MPEERLTALLKAMTLWWETCVSPVGNASGLPWLVPWCGGLAPAVRAPLRSGLMVGYHWGWEKCGSVVFIFCCIRFHGPFVFCLTKCSSFDCIMFSYFDWLLKQVEVCDYGKRIGHDICSWLYDCMCSISCPLRTLNIHPSYNWC